ESDYYPNQAYFYCEEGTGIYRSAGEGPMGRMWCTDVTYFIVGHNYEDGVCTICGAEQLPESEHNYPDSADETWTYTLDGATNGVYVTFDEQTRTESGYDYIYIYDGEDNMIGQYSGTTLAGATIYVPTDTFTIQLTSDSNTNYWGFAVTNVEAAGDTIDLSLYGTVADLLEQVFVGDTPTVDVYLNGGLYLLTEDVDYTLTADTSEANVGTYVDVTITGIGKYTGTLTTSVYVWDYDHQIIPESDHNYASNTDETWVYTLLGAENGVYVTFDERTETEEGYDYIYVYDGDGNQLGKYDGTTLAGATVYVPTASFSIRLTSDSSQNRWGFAVTDISAVGDTIDLGLVGSVDDPLEQVFVGDAPTADVKINGTSLTEGEDFTVSADTSEANVGTYVEVTITGIGNYTGTLTTTVYVWDYDHQLMPESDHPYADSTDESWTYTLLGAENGIYVTFDEQTRTESGYDYIYIYDGDGNQLGKYDGTTLAGATVYVPTESVTIRLTSDSGTDYWGFAVTDIEAVGSTIDLDRGVASVDDPANAVYVGETPTPDVTLNGTSLVQDVDFTVSADTSEANVGTYVEVTITGIGAYSGTMTTHAYVCNEDYHWAQVTDFDITSAEHDDADQEVNQTIIVTITYSENIALAHEDLRDDLLITIAGGDVYDTDRTITYEVQNGNQLVITMVSTDWVAIYGGTLVVTDLTGEGIVPAEGEGLVYTAEQSGRIPIGIVLNNDIVAGTDAEPASTYVNVAHKANMRGMYSFELVSTDAQGNETIINNWTSHAHDFYGSITLEYIASVIAADVDDEDGYSATYNDGDTSLIITADNAVEGQTLAIRMDEIKAQINTAHAPQEVVEENNILNTQCSFCGYLYEREPANEGVGIVAQVTYADGSFESLELEEDELDAILAEQPETTLTRGSSPMTNQYIAITDLLEQTLGLENVEYLEVNSSDLWSFNSDEDFDLANAYLYDGGGYYRLAVDGASQMYWEKYVIEFVITVDQLPYPESEHPYANNEDQTWEYTLDDATNGVYVTFDERTATESGYDYIYVYDGDGNQIGKYDGTTLAGATVYVPTATFSVRLTSDFSNTEWGFAVTEVEAAGDTLDLGKAGFVDDPLDPVEKDATVTADVTFGGVTLTEDTDYTLTADTSTAGVMAEVTIEGKGDYSGTLTTHVFVYDDTAITVTDFDIASGEHDDADGEVNQTIIATITFSDNIALATDDLEGYLLIDLEGDNIYDTARNVTYEVQNGNQLVITMVSYDWVAIYGGTLTISDITRDGILAADGEGYVYMETQTGRIPTGIVVNNDMIAGTDAEPASTYVNVAHKANMRGMYNYSLISIDAEGNETVIGTWTSHAHNFYTSVDEAYIAESIASDINTTDGYTAAYNEGDTYFIVTADEAVEGENLAVRMNEIKATINEAHAPMEYEAEDGMLITRCSFCGDVFDEEPIDYADIPVYQNGELITTITGEEFAVAQAEAPEQTLYFTRGGDSQYFVTAQFVSVKDLLGDYQPDEGCGFAATAESDGFTSTFTADIYEDAYFYYEEDTGYYRTALNGAWGYMWCTDVTYFTVGHNYEDGACTICGLEQPPESDHPYDNNKTVTWDYTLEGADNGVYVTFDERTSFEVNYDYLYIYDDEDNLIGAYTGTELAGATVYVPTAGFTLELVADQMVDDWGFAVTNVEAAGDTVDLSTYASVEDPIEEVYVNDTPTADVYLNGGYYTLTQDVDFTVSADTSVAGEYAEVTITGIGKYSGTLTTHAYVWDEDHMPLPESEHNYPDNADESWTYTLDGAE
ncbi:MAG: hypothetical protein LUC17_02295, partial [Oscillospiraceae bacterium]|nr:hypothetical protein [Oscillospiraceae bacterium]